jgi:hypothetical protein
MYVCVCMYVYSIQHTCDNSSAWNGVTPRTLTEILKSQCPMYIYMCITPRTLTEILKRQFLGTYTYREHIHIQRTLSIEKSQSEPEQIHT